MTRHRLLREYTTSELAQIQPLGTIREFRGEVTVDVVREDLATALQVCRDELHFEQCAGACAIHYPDDKDAELHVVYPLLSMTYNRRLRVETTAPDWNPRLPSGVAVYPTLDWHEREAWDMFGIVFDGHPTLTRILMPDDWAGHPQRKDYPLGGVPVQYRGATVPPPDQRRPFR